MVCGHLQHNNIWQQAVGAANIRTFHVLCLPANKHSQLQFILLFSPSGKCFQQKQNEMSNGVPCPLLVSRRHYTSCSSLRLVIERLSLPVAGITFWLRGDINIYFYKKLFKFVLISWISRHVFRRREYGSRSITHIISYIVYIGLTSFHLSR